MEIQNSLTLKHFWNTCVFFFTQKQPETEEEYMEGYALVSHEWLAFKKEIDQYPISILQKNELDQLFNFAEDFFCYVNSSDHNYHSAFMQQKWHEMNTVATRIYRSTSH